MGEILVIVCFGFLDKQLHVFMEVTLIPLKSEDIIASLQSVALLSNPNAFAKVSALRYALKSGA
jgi:hypothetical protein